MTERTCTEEEVQDLMGLVKKGWLADLLLVEGDPLQDVRLLQDKAKLRLIMKDGVAWKNALAAPAA